MTPKTVYQQDLESQRFRPDPLQAQAVLKTQGLFDALMNTSKPRRKKTFLGIFKSQPVEPIRGLYFWGGVGRGKTYLIDTFFDCLPFPDKQRVHYGHFMQNLHNHLKTLPKSPDPLKIIASNLARECRVICIDEFHVDDITDAMILGGFLAALFDEGVSLVTTSNIDPDNLYKNGLQRERFLPAIELIKRHTDIVHLDSGIDYRLDLLEKHGVYHVCDPEESEYLLTGRVSELSNTQIRWNEHLTLNSRDVFCRAVSDKLIWFDFREICQTPRSSRDYIYVAQHYESVFISDIPVMHDGMNDVVQRFIQLIDALYDHRVKCISTSAAEPAQLYSGQGLNFPFQRTISRLNEMRSEAYLMQSHKP